MITANCSFFDLEIRLGDGLVGIVSPPIKKQNVQGTLLLFLTTNEVCTTREPSDVLISVVGLVI